LPVVVPRWAEDYLEEDDDPVGFGASADVKVACFTGGDKPTL
jgi:hypothetical protein